MKEEIPLKRESNGTFAKGNAGGGKLKGQLTFDI